MEPNRRMLALVGSRWLLVGLVALSMGPLEPVGGASLQLAPTNEFSQSARSELSARSDPELSFEAGRAPMVARYRRQLALYGSANTNTNNNNNRRLQLVDGDGSATADVATVAQTKALQARRHQAPLQQLTSLQASLEDEQAFRRQLPDLIAQAHNDKTVERALLKMLINSSLRSALNNMAGPQSSGAHFASNNGRPLEGAWQADTGSLEAMEPATRLARLEQLMGAGDYASLDSLDAELGQSLQQDQGYPSAVDKREYIRPCSFNAVSCAKNPFRKL